MLAISSLGVLAARATPSEFLDSKARAQSAKGWLTQVQDTDEE